MPQPDPNAAQYQKILAMLLNEEDNKYCCDCDAKGPRWASWNLGLFVCIRCAGIHRNLGVHISKVKSVNLDSWTSEQLESVLKMGNKRARDIYESNLPPGHRRPVEDFTLEQFIRNKYEKKLYANTQLLKEANFAKVDIETYRQRISSPKSRATSSKAAKPTNTIQRPPVQSAVKESTIAGKTISPAPSKTVAPKPIVAQHPQPAIDDLLGMGTPITSATPTVEKPTVNQESVNPALPSVNSDLAGLIFSSPAPSTDPFAPSANATNMTPSSVDPPVAAPNGDSSTVADSIESGSARKSKESILSLYAQAPSNQTTQFTGFTSATPNMSFGQNPGQPQQSSSQFTYQPPQVQPTNQYSQFSQFQSSGFPPMSNPQQQTQPQNQFYQPPPSQAHGQGIWATGAPGGGANHAASMMANMQIRQPPQQGFMQQQPFQQQQWAAPSQSNMNQFQTGGFGANAAMQPFGAAAQPKQSIGPFI